MYGENGSGKSSVYFALYTLLQSSIKGKNTDKYFDRTKPENLLNVFTEGATDAAHIQISFADAPTWFYTLATGGLTVAAPAALDVIEKLNLASDFISHRLLINFYNFRNSNQINLWIVFERDMIPYWLDRPKSAYLIDIYKDIRDNLIFQNTKGNLSIRKASTTYLNKIKYFNEELEYLVNQVNADASDFYNDNFRKDKENELHIKLYYQSDVDPLREAADTNKYWMRYEEVVKQVVIANTPQTYNTGFKDLQEPFIRLAIQENKGTATSPIWKAIDRPQSYLNEAKLTGIALSIRFAMLIGTNRPNVDGRILALDDLLVSLDMSNRDRVIKIILDKFVFENPFKIYIFTHDKSFYNLCKQRINQGIPADWLFYEMYANSEKQPRRPYIASYADYFEKADKHLIEFDYSAAANAIRQGLENLIFNFLPENLRYKVENNEIKKRTLGELIGQFQNFLRQHNQSLGIIKDLFVYKDLLLNPLSHDNVNTPVFRSELDAIITLLPVLKGLQTTLHKELSDPLNNEIKLVDINSAGHQITYRIALSEHLRSFILLDGNFHFSKSKCKVIDATDGTTGAVSTLNNSYDSISQAARRLAMFLGKTYSDDQAIFNQLVF